MRNTFKLRFAGTIIMLLMIAVFGVAVMLLWNALLPGLFGLPALNYWQAAGMLLLVRILFGGIGDGFTRHGRQRVESQFHGHANRLREKWMNMNEDERREFMEKEKGFMGMHGLHSRFGHFFNDENAKDKENE